MLLMFAQGHPLPPFFNYFQAHFIIFLLLLCIKQSLYMLNILSFP